ncbi:LPS O-antigen length regulator [Psychrosphaera sp. F3M07]|uniref:Wzz/FepE/Etk N-terminal domain-containing protein n=1 Tax=Psychrosphaera sp. F3M07 TaxID=2841560 RepID=UPI001C0886FF|nr:Wzz/FepE/Etk N-terminal domain-containing protein [Psychrosphaera sp. F3M07]MBU2917756.1 LPS O-antigen length regulator [Psychrosphaera sp. F3M07]
MENVKVIDIQEVIVALWRKKLMIATITSLLVVISVCIALVLPNIYQSKALLAPNSEESSGGIAGMSGQLGGIAALAGVNLGGRSTDKVSLALEVLKSRDFLFNYFKEKDLAKDIIAAKGWERSTNTLIYDESVFDVNTNSWVREVSAPYKSKPSFQELYDYFIENNLLINRDEETGFVTIAVNHYSPYLAKEIVVNLISRLNKVIQLQELEEAEKTIQFLESELETTNVAEMRSMFYQLIEQQYRTVMLTKVKVDYVLKVIDSPIVTERKYKPSRGLIVVVGALLGFFLSCILVLFVTFKNRF